jgi:hypothetical protein
LTLFRIGGPSVRDRAQQAVNEQLTGHRIDQAVSEYRKATEEPLEEPPSIIEHPIDDQLQTGESRQLGGAIEIKAPWRRE